jgi:EAL domain-containing protein (putative c-di-GMP-specific phosphodiesterase class I)
MILDIAKKFGLTSIVEGIETQEQLEFSILCCADKYQGFYFSKAVDEMSFLQMKNKEAVG